MNYSDRAKLISIGAPKEIYQKPGKKIKFYYQILDIGILFEKGRKEGRRWKIGERKRLREEVSFWINLLGYISDEENGIECSEKLFENLERLCKKIDIYKDKEMVYRILSVLHNLPKSMHGRNILNESSDIISCNDTLKYARGYMDDKMKEEYNKYFH